MWYMWCVIHVVRMDQYMGWHVWYSRRCVYACRVMTCEGVPTHAPPLPHVSVGLGRGLLAGVGGAVARGGDGRRWSIAGGGEGLGSGWL